MAKDPYEVTIIKRLSWLVEQLVLVAMSFILLYFENYFQNPFIIFLSLFYHHFSSSLFHLLFYFVFQITSL